MTGEEFNHNCDLRVRRRGTRSELRVKDPIWEKPDEKPAISALFRRNPTTARVQRSSRTRRSKTGGTREQVKEALVGAPIMIHSSWKWLTSRLPGNVTQINYSIKVWRSWPLLSLGAAKTRLQGGDYDFLLHSITVFQLWATLVEGGDDINSNLKRDIPASYAVEVKGLWSVSFPPPERSIIKTSREHCGRCHIHILYGVLNRLPWQPKVVTHWQIYWRSNLCILMNIKGIKYSENWQHRQK